ncbi:MMPL family transporter [Streptomyces sp. NPDC046862]|uniref:MMPL family transporter n=1 Tax=Streptomyces sp. NPDC046862 TaxID=3154603 RepID=UPI003454FAF2
MEHDFDGDAVKSIDSLLLLRSDGTPKEQGAALQAYAERLGATEGATNAQITDIGGSTARVSVAYDGNPISTHARDLVNRIKEVPPPPGAKAYIGGESAIYDDTWTHSARPCRGCCSTSR